MPNKFVELLMKTSWPGWGRWLLLLICVAAMMLLGVLRVVTDAEFSVASLLLLPILLVTWLSGRISGLVISVLASVMWLYGDIESEHLFSAAWVPWANAATRLMTYAIVTMLASEVRIRFQRERDMARRDELTGLQNRRAFLESGVEEVNRSLRYGHPLALLFLDLDDFKQLNDTRGHDVGDVALQATARVLRDNLRSADRVARLGGDEYAILLPELEYDNAVLAAQKLVSAVNGALGSFPPVKASMGVAWFAKPDRSFERMLQVADGLMYEAKNSGKNAVKYQSIPVDPETGAVSQRR